MGRTNLDAQIPLALREAAAASPHGFAVAALVGTSTPNAPPTVVGTVPVLPETAEIDILDTASALADTVQMMLPGGLCVYGAAFAGTAESWESHVKAVRGSVVQAHLDVPAALSGPLLLHVDTTSDGVTGVTCVPNSPKTVTCKVTLRDGVAASLQSFTALPAVDVATEGAMFAECLLGVATAGGRLMQPSATVGKAWKSGADPTNPISVSLVSRIFPAASQSLLVATVLGSAPVGALIDAFCEDAVRSLQSLALLGASHRITYTVTLPGSEPILLSHYSDMGPSEAVPCIQDDWMPLHADPPITLAHASSFPSSSTTASPSTTTTTTTTTATAPSSARKTPGKSAPVWIPVALGAAAVLLLTVWWMTRASDDSPGISDEL